MQTNFWSKRVEVSTSTVDKLTSGTDVTLIYSKTYILTWHLPSADIHTFFAISGLSQGIESGPINRDSPEKTKLIHSPSIAPRPVFQSNRLNRYNSTTSHQPGHQQPGQEIISPQHQALIKYIGGQWRCVKKEFEEGGNVSSCLTGNGSTGAGSSSGGGRKSSSNRNKVPKTSIKSKLNCHL